MMGVGELFETLMLSGIIVAALPLCYYAYRLGLGMNEAAYAEKLNANTSCPPMDDFEKEAINVIGYLNGRCEKMYLNPDGEELSERFGVTRKMLPHFLRYFHALGCELVIRRIANRDIEEMKD